MAAYWPLAPARAATSRLPLQRGPANCEESSPRGLVARPLPQIPDYREDSSEGGRIRQRSKELPTERNREGVGRAKKKYRSAWKRSIPFQRPPQSVLGSIP